MRRAVRQLLAIALVATLVAAPVSAAGSTGINFGADATPNPEMPVDVTKSAHEMGTDPLEYEDNSGNLISHPGVVNSSADNPYSYVATDVNSTDFSSFPHNKDDVAFTDAAEWTSGSNGSASNAETAPNVDAIRLDTDGSLASGDSATFTFSNFSITSDENKRTLSVAQDVSTIESGVTVEYRVVDEDGDYKVAELNTSRSSGDDFMGNASGEGYVYQEQLGNLALQSVSGSDGSFDNLDKIEVVVVDGDADVSVSLLNVDKMSPYSFGKEKYQNDSDDELETREHIDITEPGAIDVYDLSTIGFSSDTTIHGLTVDAIIRAEDLSSDDTKLELEKDDSDKYPGFYGAATFYYRFELDDAYELSWSGPELENTQDVTNSRVLNVEYAESTGDTAFADISDSAFADHTNKYSGEGANVTHDSTIQPGSASVLKFKFKLTESQYKNVQTAGFGGSGGGPVGMGLSNLPIIGGIFAALVAILAKLGD